MTKKELERRLEEMRKATAEITSSKEKAREFLHTAGIITRAGKLAKPYR